jgi:undecaprenyl-diphosphatase
LVFFVAVVGNIPGEVAVSEWVQSWQTPWLDAVMKAVSEPGYWIQGPIILGLTVAFLCLRGLWREGTLLLAFALSSSGINIALKNLIARPRPTDDVVQVFQSHDSYAFPSGHVMSYMIFLGILAVIATTRMNPGPYRTLVQGSLAMGIAGVGVSRIYLGAHLLGDVVAAYAVGAVLVAAAFLVWNYAISPAKRSASRGAPALLAS